MSAKPSFKDAGFVGIIGEIFRWDRNFMKYISKTPLFLIVLVIGGTATRAQNIPPPPPLDSDLTPQINDTPGQYSPFVNPTPLEEIDLVAPSPEPETPSISPSRLYRVEIPGSSSLLLTQVQRFEPNAFIRAREGVIQAGVFSEERNAQQFVSNLGNQGIQARVVQVGSDIDSRNIGSDVAARLARDPAYYVVIPGDKEDLPEIASKVQEMGVELAGISLRDAPRGPHVAVGPFVEEDEARRWNSYLRSRGFNARIYFGK